MITELQKSNILNNDIRRCKTTWQNVISVVRMSLLASRFLTHTDVLTEHGNQTFSVLRLL